jgi:Cu-Zn family superoxide dismutase
MRRTSIRMLGLVALLGISAAALYAGSANATRRRGLVAYVKDVSNNRVATVRMAGVGDGAVVVWITAHGLTPGFHGYHIHTTGVCDPKAVDTTGATVPFFSAGGHYNPVAAMTHGSHAGDMPPLLVMGDGTAALRFKTDRFALRDLLDDDGSAVIIHAGSDNLSNIPLTTPTGAERYHSHVDDVLGPDTATKATGDAGSRFACGVVRRAID